MTPLGGFLKKILGGTSTPAPTPVAAPPGGSRLRTTAPDDDRGAPDDGEHSGRRRGSRGGRGRGNSAADAPGAQATPSSEAPAPSTRGRGRGRGTSDAPAASTEARSYTWSARPSGDSNETEEQARQRREQASRQRRGRTPSFRPYRENLDAPLPEDIAFRSGAEGGVHLAGGAAALAAVGLVDNDREIAVAVGVAHERDELRLAWRRQAALGREPERGAGRLRRERAEPLLAEVAVATAGVCSRAHMPFVVALSTR